MEITTVYQKERRDFGRPVNAFLATEPQLLDEFPPEKELTGTYIERNPSFLDVQAIPEMSEHEVRPPYPRLAAPNAPTTLCAKPRQHTLRSRHRRDR